jgi:hypothetical protein
LAKNPQQTIAELKELVVDYAKQETIEPLKGVGRYLRNGTLGALLMGLGIMFLAIAALRALQTETDEHFTGNWSIMPYVIVIVGLAIIAGLSAAVASKAVKKKNLKVVATSDKVER